MKKSALLAIASLTTLTIVGSPIKVAAVSVNEILEQVQNNGKVIVANGKNMNEIKDKLSQLGIDLDNINWNCPTIPKPEPETPETETPETEEPETEIPETGLPETELPETEVPETEAPETEAPETETPETEVPETEEESNTDRTFAEQVVKLVNEERSKRGLSPLTLDRTIETAALVRAKETEISFSHTRPNGSSFSTALKEQGISYMGAGENIAYGQRTPEEVMKGWMNSDGHRANILNASFTKIGVGYYQNSKGTNYWTQLFTY